MRVEEYFRGTKITAYAGAPPEREKTDYCWGGCPGAIEEAIEILRQFDTATDAKMQTRRPLHVVFGAYKGEIPAKPGEKVVFIGDCTQYKGSIGGADIDLTSLYVDRSLKDPHQAAHQDIFAKMYQVGKLLKQHRGDQVLRIRGCPVSVSEQVLLLVHLMGLKDPFTGPDAPKFVSAYLSWRTHNLIQRLRGSPYQIAGPTERGQSRPDQNLPTSGLRTPLELSV